MLTFILELRFTSSSFAFEGIGSARLEGQRSLPLNLGVIAVAPSLG